MQLKPLSCYAKIANVNVVFKYEFGYLNLSIIAADFVEKEKSVETMFEKSDIKAIIDDPTAETVQPFKLRLVCNDDRQDNRVKVKENAELETKNVDKESEDSDFSEALVDKKAEEGEETNDDVYKNIEDECIQAKEVFDPINT
jgi:hypothetical protein